MNSEIKYWYLRDHKLFKNLSFSEIDALCILKRFRKTKKDEIVELPYNEKNRIYFLKHGILKLIKITDEGDEILIDIFKKGDLFGELDFEKGSDEKEFIKVVSDDAIICTFFKEKLEEVMHQKPDFAINYIKFIGFNYKKIQNSYRNILFKDAKIRLLLFLYSLCEKDQIESGQYTIPNYLTQKDIAQLICTTRQTVISLFKELEKDGVIVHQDKSAVISEVENLKKLLKL